MTVENATYISDLNNTYPRSDDLIAEGDDHIRMIKKVMLNTFPGLNGPVNATASTLNALGSNVTSDGSTLTFSANLAITSGKSLSAGGNKITSVGTPTAASDAANKDYVDRAAAAAASGAVGSVVLTPSSVGLSNLQNWGVTASPNANTYAFRGADGKSQFVDVYITSDKRLKNNFEPISHPLNKLNRISGQIYDKFDKPEDGKFVGREAGVIAQDVEAALPVAVSEIDGVKHVSQSAMIALLVESVKELTNRVHSLELRLSFAENKKG